VEINSVLNVGFWERSTSIHNKLPVPVVKSAGQYAVRVRIEPTVHVTIDSMFPKV